MLKFTSCLVRGVCSVRFRALSAVYTAARRGTARQNRECQSSAPDSCMMHLDVYGWCV